MNKDSLKEPVEVPQDLSVREGYDLAESPVTPRTPRPPRRRYRFIIAGVIAIIVVAIGIATTYMFTKSVPSTSQSNDSSLAASAQFSSAQALVDEIKPELKGSLIAVENVNGLGGSNGGEYIAYGPPMYRVAEAQFTSLPLVSVGAGYTGDSVTATENYESLVRFFKDNKFKRISELKDGRGAVSPYDSAAYISYAEYESTELLCAIRHVDASATDLKGYVSSIGCATKESYKMATNSLKPFYDIYVEGDGEPSRDLVFGVIDQGDGLDGYKYASLYQQDADQFDDSEENTNHTFTGLYFKDPKEDKWQYFIGLHENTGLLKCAEFNSDALKKAFAGFNCFDELKQQDSKV